MLSLLLSVFLLVFVPSSAGAGEMLLIRGNYWVNGIPGFGVNGFSALSGDYRYRAGEVPDEGGREEVFSVYLTREPLFFPSEWQSRQGTGGIQVFQRRGEEGFLAAALLDDGMGSTWFAVFWFKQGLQASGFGEEDFNRMLRIWAGRVIYFVSLSKSPRDISLPAAVEF